jgi:hypothetical protein
MLPGAPLLLEPLEYPPPYPPPLALAKDKVGSPIRAITIIAAMSFVGFNVRVLSIDVAGQSSAVILAEVVPGKSKIREPPTEDCYLFFWFVWFFWLNETINGPSKFACFPSPGRALMLVEVRPSNEALLRARVPGAQNQRGCPSNPLLFRLLVML